MVFNNDNHKRNNRQNLTWQFPHLFAFTFGAVLESTCTQDDVIKWKHFPRYWPFVRGIHQSPMNSSHKGQWCGALISSLICTWINGWVNNREAGDLRRHRAHYDVIVMSSDYCTYSYIWHTIATSLNIKIYNFTDRKLISQRNPRFCYAIDDGHIFLTYTLVIYVIYEW